MNESYPRSSHGSAFDTFRHAGVVLVLLLACTVAAFWKPYVLALRDPVTSFDWTLHAHASLMGGWVVLLCVQALLVRIGSWRLHRTIGRASFLYVPLAVVSGLVTMRTGMVRGVESVSPEAARDATFQHMMLLSFVVTWALGIRNRREPARHVRYMISTVFAIGSAIFFRIFVFLVPGFEDFDRAAHANFVVMGILLVALIWNDRRVSLSRSPYLVITTLLVLQFLAYRFVSAQPWWVEYCNLIAGFR